MRRRLHWKNVKTLPVPETGQVDYYDHGTDSVPGLAVRVSYGGKRVYTVTYRAGARQRRYTIAAVEELGLAQAREEARKIRARVRLGEDPQAVKSGERTRSGAMPFSQLAESYITDRKARGEIVTTTEHEYRRMIAAYIKEPLASMPADAVNATDLERRLLEIAKDAPVMANRVHQFFRAVCRWGRRKNVLPANPMDTVERPRKETTRERVLSDAEIRYLFAALEDASPALAGLVKTWLYLGQRRTETAKMRRADLDLGAEIPQWNIPGVHRKGGEPHVVPLPVPVVNLLRGLENKDERIFAPVSLGNWHDLFDPIRRRVYLVAAKDNVKVAPFTIHDLRRTCTTGMTKLGVSRAIADRVIGHRQNGVASIYDRHEYMRERAAALTTWAAYVETIVTGKRAKIRAFGKGA